MQSARAQTGIYRRVCVEPRREHDAPAGNVRRPPTGPFMFALNAGSPKQVAQTATAYALPNVEGLPLRDAVRQLHASGYRVQVEGTGIVRTVSAPRGNVVRIGAEAAR